MPRYNFHLHCDDCHHEVHFEGSMTRRHVGWPCPVCGSNMLTEADFKRGARIQRLLKVLQFFRIVRSGNYDDRPGAGEVKMRLHGHNGQVNVKLEAGE